MKRFWKKNGIEEDFGLEAFPPQTKEMLWYIRRTVFPDVYEEMSEQMVTRNYPEDVALEILAKMETMRYVEKKRKNIGKNGATALNPYLDAEGDTFFPDYAEIYGRSSSVSTEVNERIWKTCDESSTVGRRGRVDVAVASVFDKVLRREPEPSGRDHVDRFVSHVVNLGNFPPSSSSSSRTAPDARFGRPRDDDYHLSPPSSPVSSPSSSPTPLERRKTVPGPARMSSQQLDNIFNGMD